MCSTHARTQAEGEGHTRDACRERDTETHTGSTHDVHIDTHTITNARYEHCYIQTLRRVPSSHAWHCMCSILYGAHTHHWARMHTHTHTHTLRTHAHTHCATHAHTHSTHTHTRTHAHTHTHTLCARMHTHTHTLRTHARMHTHTHTLRTHAHTHTHTHTLRTHAVCTTTPVPIHTCTWVHEHLKSWDIREKNNSGTPLCTVHACGHTVYGTCIYVRVRTIYHAAKMGFGSATAT